MMRDFFAAWGGALRDGVRFARALPWLLVLMIGIELVQHGVEAHLGFFDADHARRVAASMASTRMLFGWPKMAMVYALGFLATRWMVCRDGSETLHPSRRAIGRYALVALFQLTIAAVVIYAEPLLAAGGIGKAGVMPLRLVASLFQQLAEPLLFLWYVNAAMGTASYGPVASARATGRFYFWALLLMFVARLPFNAAHQLLNRWPAGARPAVLWTALSVDAAVVGFMVVVLAAVQVRIAQVIVTRRGRALLVDDAVGAVTDRRVLAV